MLEAIRESLAEDGIPTSFIPTRFLEAIVLDGDERRSPRRIGIRLGDHAMVLVEGRDIHDRTYYRWVDLAEPTGLEQLTAMIRDIAGPGAFDQPVAKS
jgi:hypothetical protein